MHFQCKIICSKVAPVVDVHLITTSYLPSRGSFKNRFLKSIKSHDLGSILSTSYFYSFTLEGLYIIF